MTCPICTQNHQHLAIFQPELLFSTNRHEWKSATSNATVTPTTDSAHLMLQSTCCCAYNDHCQGHISDPVADNTNITCNIWGAISWKYKVDQKSEEWMCSKANQQENIPKLQEIQFQIWWRSIATVWIQFHDQFILPITVEEQLSTSACCQSLRPALSSLLHLTLSVQQHWHLGKLVSKMSWPDPKLTKKKVILAAQLPAPVQGIQMVYTGWVWGKRDEERTAAAILN